MNEVAERTANPFGAATPRSQGALISTEQQRAIAEVQAALVMARAQPRDPVEAMDRILLDCTRTTLAEQAEYEYPRGNEKVKGASIRLAETIARRWGNIECGVKELSRRDGVSECLAYAWDLETNFRDVKTFSVRHWRDTKKGGYGVTEERDIYELVANYGARRKRACILAIVPGDVTEAAITQCRTTILKKINIDEEFIATLLARYAEQGVTKDMIEKRIGHGMSVETLSPALAVQLRRIYTSLRDGMSAPGDWFELSEAQVQTDAPAAANKTEAVKSRMKKRTPKNDPPTSEGAQGEPPAGDDDEVHLTYAQVADWLQKANTTEELDTAADSVQAVYPPAHREELLKLYREKRDALEPFESQPPRDGRQPK